MKKIKNLYNKFRIFIGKPIFLKQKTVLINDKISYCKNPIFILSMHRSGSTMFRKIINSHHKIACPPETHYLNHFFDFFSNEHSINGLEGIVDKKEIKNEIQKLAFKYHEAYRISNNKEVWADKTPEYLFRVKDLFNLAPSKTRYIILLRDPYDIFYSIYDRKWILEKTSDDLCVNTINYIKKGYKNIAMAMSYENTFITKYEDLCHDPKNSVKAICKFLEVDFQESMISYWKYEHNFGTEDPVSRSMKKIEISKEKWKNLDDAIKLKMIKELSPIREKLNYE